MANSNATEPQREPLTGLIERVTFHSAETGFCVLRVKVRGHHDLITVLGTAAEVHVGQHIQASGQWQQHREHGQQFRASFLQVVPPSSIEGIRRYLGSGMIKGIGPHLAGRLVAAFGEAVFDVIERAPERLLEVEGIGKTRLKRITAGWGEQKAIREIMVFLQSHGVGTSRAVRIFKSYGPDAIPLVKENPYRLARDIRGIGFITADQIAQQLGIPKTSMLRARAGISYALLQAVENGDCGLPEDDLLTLGQKLLEINRPLLEEALALETAEGAVVAEPLAGQPCVFLPYLRHAEDAIAHAVRRLRVGQIPWPSMDADKAIAWVERRLDVTLAPGQRQAVAKALASKILIVTGGPGVGKTTIIRAILAILRAKGVTPLLAAPTGRAAKRLAETTGPRPRPSIVCWSSTASVAASAATRRPAPRMRPARASTRRRWSTCRCWPRCSRAAMPPAAAVLVGDVDQLPSVGPGQVLADLIGCGRRARGSADRDLPPGRARAASSSTPTASIAGECRSLRRRATSSDFYFIKAPIPRTQPPSRQAGRRAHSGALRPRSDQRRAGAAPMNRGGSARAHSIRRLQAALNPRGTDAPSVERFGFTYRLGDKVMQIENNYDRETSSTATSASSPRSIDEEGELAVDFDGRAVVYSVRRARRAGARLRH